MKKNHFYCLNRIMTTNNGDLQKNRVAEGQEPLKTKIPTFGQKEQRRGSDSNRGPKNMSSDSVVRSIALAYRATKTSTTKISRSQFYFCLVIAEVGR